MLDPIHTPTWGSIIPLQLFLNKVKRGEKSITYLTHVYRLPQSIESPERTDKKQEFQSTLWLSTAVEVD